MPNRPAVVAEHMKAMMLEMSPEIYRRSCQIPRNESFSTYFETSSDFVRFPTCKRKCSQKVSEIAATGVVKDTVLRVWAR